MPGSYIDHEVWAVSNIDFNPDGAIYKYWRELRSNGQYLGIPVTPEIETPVGVQQAFSSGMVIGWSPDEGAYLVD